MEFYVRTINELETLWKKAAKIISSITPEFSGGTGKTSAEFLWLKFEGGTVSPLVCYIVAVHSFLR
jgi:hypothetical protein